MSLLIRIANVKYFLLYSALFLIFSIGSLLKSIPFLKSFVCDIFNAVTNTKLPQDHYWNSLFSWEMLSNVFHCVLLDINKKVHLGCKAYNCPVVSIDGKKCFRLLDQMKGNRPLVLNFGSASCPIFVEQLKEFSQMAYKYRHVADFLIVYIAEAHPEDGWRFENNNSIPTHRNQDERCAAAQILCSYNLLCPVHVVVDSMLDAVNISYGAAPIRMYIVQKGEVVYEGGAGPMGYRLDHVREWLDEKQ